MRSLSRWNTRECCKLENKFRGVKTPLIVGLILVHALKSVAMPSPDLQVGDQKAKKIQGL